MSKFIQVTTAYNGVKDRRVTLNTAHIIYVSAFDLNHPHYTNAKTMIEYTGLPEVQNCYVQESYEQIIEMLRGDV
jgi:hypothetical protein